MTIPPSSNPKWSELVKGMKNCKLSFLAAKMRLARLRILVDSDPSPERVRQCADEIRELYAQYANLEKVKHDIQLIFEV